MSSIPYKELLTASALRLAALIRKREVSPVEVVSAHIERIQQVNPVINALVAGRFEGALAEARAAEALAGQGGRLPPLLGVPFTVKEAIAVKGAPYTSGSVLRKGITAAEDAAAVARVRAAGAIPLGVSNVSEMCMWMETDNLLYGTTGNPYDPSRTAGGSSGGEGALVGAGASPFGVGADIGGSIRMPAFFCGVFGHKPTGGLVPNTGHYPTPRGGVSSICTTGPICRRAEDLMPLLSLMAGPDGVDPETTSEPLSAPSDVPLDGLRVLVCEELGLPLLRPEPAVREATLRAARLLAARGATVEPWTSPLLRHALTIWSSTIEACGGPPFCEVMGEGSAPHLAGEWLRFALGRPRHTLPALGLATLERAMGRLSGASKGRFVEEGHRLRDELEQRLGPRGLLVMPTHPRSAPRHGVAMRLPLHWMYTAIFNALRLPATAVPMGMDEAGLPVGVQLVGRRMNDPLCIAGALALERETGGWIFPEGLGRGPGPAPMREGWTSPTPPEGIRSSQTAPEPL